LPNVSLPKVKNGVVKEASFPKLFLLLATIANIAKQISLGCYLATRVRAIHMMILFFK
jgi:hypothetical protein